MEEHHAAPSMSPHVPAVDIQFSDLPLRRELPQHDSVQPDLELPTVLDVDLTQPLDDDPAQQPVRRNDKGQLDR